MADRGRRQAPVQPARLEERRAAALTDTPTVVEAQLATANRAGGAAGPKTLPETLDQSFQRRAHGAGGSGRREFTRLSAPPERRCEPGIWRRPDDRGGARARLGRLGELRRRYRPPVLRPSAGRCANCCTRRHVHLRNTPITRPMTLTS